jgi:hypothetical protein
MASFCFGVLPQAHGRTHLTPPPAHKVPDLAERTKLMTGWFIVANCAAIARKSRRSAVASVGYVILRGPLRLGKACFC